MLIPWRVLLEKIEFWGVELLYVMITISPGSPTEFHHILVYYRLETPSFHRLFFVGFF